MQRMLAYDEAQTAQPTVDLQPVLGVSADPLLGVGRLRWFGRLATNSVVRRMNQGD